MTWPSVLSEVLKSMRDRLPQPGALRLDGALVGPAILAEVTAMERDGMWDVFFNMGIVPADVADRLRAAGWQPMKERQ